MLKQEASTEERTETSTMEIVDSEQDVKKYDNNQVGFHVGTKAKTALLTQLQPDAKLLEHCQVMDYSLLVGVVDMDIHP